MTLHWKQSRCKQPSSWGIFSHHDIENPVDNPTKNLKIMWEVSNPQHSIGNNDHGNPVIVSINICIVHIPFCIEERKNEENELSWCCHGLVLAECCMHIHKKEGRSVGFHSTTTQ